MSLRKIVPSSKFRRKIQNKNSSRNSNPARSIPAFGPFATTNPLPSKIKPYKRKDVISRNHHSTHQAAQDGKNLESSKWKCHPNIGTHVLSNSVHSNSNRRMQK
jgi:hypothetical protein